MDMQDIASHTAASSPKKNICMNCHQPKSEHSIQDTFCLKVNGWTQEDLIRQTPGDPHIACGVELPTVV